MIYLTLLRHGHIEAADQLIGQTDLPLSAQGWQDMGQAVKIIHHLAPITQVYSSPLQRCKTFAERVLSPICPVEIDSRLQEIHFGQWEKQSIKTLYQSHPNWQAQFQSGRFAPPQAENYPDFRQRIADAYHSWPLHDPSHTLVICHGGVITELLALTLGWSNAQAKQLYIGRGGWVSLSILPPHPAYLLHLESPCAA